MNDNKEIVFQQLRDKYDEIRNLFTEIQIIDEKLTDKCKEAVVLENVIASIVMGLDPIQAKLMINPFNNGFANGTINYTPLVCQEYTPMKTIITERAYNMLHLAVGKLNEEEQKVLYKILNIIRGNV